MELPSPRKLPTFTYKGKAWTVDKRLQEFRFVVLGRMPEFVPFESAKGVELLLAYWKSHPFEEVDSVEG
jgi:hypothetical protein